MVARGAMLPRPATTRGALGSRAAQACHTRFLLNRSSLAPALGLMRDASSLSWRPVHVPAAEQVEVQVRHRLPGSFAAINDQPITVRNPELFGQLGRHHVQVANKVTVAFSNVRV